MKYVFAFTATYSLLTCQLPALAQTPDAPNEGQRAVELGHEAITASEAGDWETALAKFSEAEKLSHSPVFMLYAARSARNLGRLLEAEQRLTEIVDEDLGESDPVAWHQAQRDARAELAALKDRIPTVTVSVKNGDGPVSVRINGKQAPAGKPVAVDPGETEVVVERSDGKVQRSVARVAEGTAETLSISFSIDDSPPANKKDGPLWPGIVLLGVGAAGLGVGAVTGLVAAGDASDLKDACGSDNSCPPELATDGDAAATTALVSTVGFIAGGVAAAAGVTWLVVRPFGSDPTDAVTVGVELRPTSVALTGSF